MKRRFYFGDARDMCVQMQQLRHGPRHVQLPRRQ